jgi:hypothetical protein
MSYRVRCRAATVLLCVSVIWTGVIFGQSAQADHGASERAAAKAESIRECVGIEYYDAFAFDPSVQPEGAIVYTPRGTFVIDVVNVHDTTGVGREVLMLDIPEPGHSQQLPSVDAGFVALVESCF